MIDLEKILSGKDEKMNALRLLNQRPRKLVLILIPIGITGSGKSTLSTKI